MSDVREKHARTGVISPRPVDRRYQRRAPTSPPGEYPSLDGEAHRKQRASQTTARETKQSRRPPAGGALSEDDVDVVDIDLEMQRLPTRGAKRPSRAKLGSESLSEEQTSGRRQRQRPEGSPQAPPTEANDAMQRVYDVGAKSEAVVDRMNRKAAAMTTMASNTQSELDCHGEAFRAADEEMDNMRVNIARGRRKLSEILRAVFCDRMIVFWMVLLGACIVTVVVLTVVRQ